MSTQVVTRTERYFLSHSGEDKWVALLVAKIMNRHGIPFWLDVLHCQETNNVAILRAVEKCECIVVISSRGYNTSKWCQKELQHAREHHKRIECLRLERNSSGNLYYEDLPGTDLPKESPVDAQKAINDFFSKFVKSNLTPGEIRQLPRWIDDLQGLQELGVQWTMDLVLDNIGIEVVPSDPFSIPGVEGLDIWRPESGTQRNSTENMSGADAFAFERAITRESEALGEDGERQNNSCSIFTIRLYCLACLVVHFLPVAVFSYSSSIPIESKAAAASGSNSAVPALSPLGTMETMPSSNTALHRPTTSGPTGGPSSDGISPPSARPPETLVPSSSPPSPEDLFESKVYIRIGRAEGPLFFANRSVSEPLDYDEVVSGLQQSFSYRINSVTENEIAFIYFTYYFEMLFGACRWTFDNAAVPINAGLSNWIIGDDCQILFETRRMDIQVSITPL